MEEDRTHQAILMAAGVGSRLAAHIHQPKSALSLDKGGGETIIGHTVQMLHDKGFHTNIVVGYQREAIKEVLVGASVSFIENPFYRATNSIASLWFARNVLLQAAANKQDVVMGNADVFWSRKLLDRLLADEHNMVLLTDKSRTTVGDYFFTVDDNGCIAAYGKDLAVEQRSCEYVGVGKVRHQALATFIEHLDRLIWDESHNMWWEDTFYRFIDTTPVHVLDVEGDFWGEVDTIEDYQRLLDHTASEG